MADSADTTTERERVLAILTPILVGHRPWQAGDTHDPSKG